MQNAVGKNHRVRFKPFELDPQTRELYRNGIRLRVHGQPIDVLEMLLEVPGELVTREQLRKKLWPDDTFVDFEHSLNSAVTRLREALGDRADAPKFIETLPRVGYRFVASVDPDPDPDPSCASVISATSFAAKSTRSVELVPAPGVTRKLSAAPVTFPRQPESLARNSRWSKILVVSVSLLIVSAAAVLWFVRKSQPHLHVSKMTRLTTDVRWAGKLAIGTDEGRVFLRLEGVPPLLGEVPASGGEIKATEIQVPNLMRLYSVSPDGNSVIACGKFDPNDDMSELWVASINGSPVRYLTRALCVWRAASWSPDGKTVIYSTADGSIYTIPSAGGEPQLIRRLDGEAALFAYSPDGKKIRFTYSRGSHGRVWRIWEMSSKGDNLHEILPTWRPGVSTWNGRWTADGTSFVFLLTESALRPFSTKLANQIWMIDERHRLLGRSKSTPIQLTYNTVSWSTPIPSRDGQTVFAESYEFAGDLIRYNLRSKRLEPFLGGRSAEMLDFSRDGKFLIYDSFPDGTLWRANRDGSSTQQLAKAPYQYFVNPRISPDGTQIAFSDNRIRDGAETSAIYLVSSQGGVPVPVIQEDLDDEYSPSWSPDGRKLAFGVWTTRHPKSVDLDSEVRVVDLATRNVTRLPAPPRRSHSPQWSPDGRHIVCLTLPNQFEPADGLEIYDFETNRWDVILRSHHAEWPTWSRDGQSIYFVDSLGEGRFTFYRVRPDGGGLRAIENLTQFREAGFFWNWFGFDPDGNPLMLRNAGTDELFALTLERK